VWEAIFLYMRIASCLRRILSPSSSACSMIAAVLLVKRFFIEVERANLLGMQLARGYISKVT